MMTDEEFVRSRKKQYVDREVGEVREGEEVGVQTDFYD